MPTEHEGAVRKVVVVGGGMVGHRFIAELRKRDVARRFRMVLIAEEPYLPYDRIHLASYLEGRQADPLLLAKADWYSEQGVRVCLGARAASIDVTGRSIETTAGVEPFDELVLATGSHSWKPPVPGIDHPKVLVFRTISDLNAIADAASHAKRATVIGGGLLGLEAAKILVDLGLHTQVIEGAPRLMPRQLDLRGAALLARKLTAMGIETRSNVQLSAILDSGAALQLQFRDGTCLESDLVVVAAGIRPNDSLAREAGIACHERGGITIDDCLRTSAPGIYAIGECAEHRGTVYGLVGPGYSMANVLAERLVGEEKKAFSGADPSTRLKLLGVDVASAGDPFADERGGVSTFLESSATGIYQKIVLDETGTRVVGAILVGDSKPYGRILSLIQSGKRIDFPPESLFANNDPAAAAGACDDELICTCNSVNRASIAEVIGHANGECSIELIKQSTGAGTGCGGCTPRLGQIVQLELRRLGKATRPRICEHFALSRQELFDLVHVHGYRTFDQVLDAHGSGSGCETCKPVIASILASLHNEHILEHAQLQDTNDRFLANIQRQGLYSVVPRIAAGEVTPAQLMAIARIAEKYQLYTKITGGQRIDLFGARIDQLPAIWEELVGAGFESGHAYGKAVRTVKSCVGSTWCRFGLNDSVSFAIRVEHRYKGIRAPHKLKSAVSGCIRECAEVQSKDFGFIATEQGWNLYVCGNGGSRPRHAELLASNLSDEMALKLADRFLMYYIRTADKLTRTSTWMDGLEGGIGYLRKVIVDDSLGIASELEKQMQGLVAGYECEWKKVLTTPRLRAQFELQATRLEDHKMVVSRTQQQPAPWPKQPNALARVHLPIVSSTWRSVANAQEVPPGTGITVKHGKSSIAVFHTADGRWFATQAQCPHKGDAVLGRGIVGDQGGLPKVACPFHKRTFSLETGECLNAASPGLARFPIRIDNELIQLELPAAEALEEAFAKAAYCDAHCEDAAQAAE